MSLALVVRVARWVAIGIAVLAVIDPVVVSPRRMRPEVAVVATPATDSNLIERVRDRLDGSFTLIDGPFAGAAGTVLVGNALPESTSELAAPAFAVIPATARAAVAIERVDLPRRSALESSTSIAVTVRAIGVRGQRLDVVLRSGALGVDRVSWEVPGDDARRVIELAYVPTTTGPAPLRVEIEPNGMAAPVAADLVVDVREQRWPVLFFDPRPSWMSTFVRRSIERDPRFTVSSRVATSRGLGTEAGRPPATLGDPAALAPFDVIVVGAPEALGDRDVAGLDAYLRRRGGSVILLLDQRAPGAYQRLANVREWSGTSNAAGIAVTRPDAGSDSSGGLRASSVAWPRALAAGARTLAVAHVTGADSATPRPVIWRSSVSAGQIIVSGALDAWRYRDRAVSAFDVFWRSTIGSAAEAAIPPIAVSLDNAIVAPSERATLDVTLRDAAVTPVVSGRSARARVAAALETPDGRVPIHLWPEGPIGRLRGTFRAPPGAGSYRIVVTSDGMTADVPLVVSPSIMRPEADESALVTAWVGSRGGRALPDSQLDDLTPALERTLRPAVRRETWYPMRSPWWLIPFVTLLGAEWLWRRRRGFA